MTRAERSADQIVREWVEGLDGVLPGPWMVAYDGDTECPMEVVQTDNWDNRICFPTSDRAQTADHIARFDPGSVRTVSASYEAMKAALEAIRKEARKNRPNPDAIYELASNALAGDQS